MINRLGAFQVILPVFNESHRVRASLDFYSRHCSSVLVIDNMSSDGTAEIVRESFPCVGLIQVRNAGTIETPLWWSSVMGHFSEDYVLLASCSESVPLPLLTLFDSLCAIQAADLFQVERSSCTSGVSTDDLYCSAGSLFSFANKLPTVVRVLKWRSIVPTLIYPHDSFRSQVHCSKISVLSTSEEYRILHLRPSPSFRSAEKLIAYSRQYAFYRLKLNPLAALLDSSARVLLDTLRIARSLLLVRCSRTLLAEYFLRLFMHLSVVYNTLLFFHRSRRFVP